MSVPKLNWEFQEEPNPKQIGGVLKNLQCAPTLKRHLSDVFNDILLR
jgi:hypothetical protein